MAKCMKKIIMIFRKGYEKWLRKMIAKAYPDGERFLSLLTSIPDERNAFLFDGGFAATSFISARGINTSIMTYEQFKDFIEKHPERRVVPGVIMFTSDIQSYTDCFKSAKGKNQ